MSLRNWLLSLMLAGSAGQAFGNTPYPVDFTPFANFPELAAEWHQLRLDLEKETPQRERQLKRLLEVGETLSARQSDWVDIQWMLAEVAFQLGSLYQDPKDLPYARSVFVRGEKAVEKCLNRQKDHIICKLFLGAMIGKIASIDGVFSAIRKAKRVEQLWLDVTLSPHNYRLTSKSTVQGGARYALGLFYRLVPDMTILEWLIGVKGDIEKAVQYQRDAIAADGPNVCNKMMLGVALLCASKGDKKDDRKQEGFQHLREAQKIEVDTSVARVCFRDIPSLLADPSLACGYESSRQQDLDTKELPK